MGFLHGNVCFPSVEAAKQSACSGASATWGQGSSLYSASCTTTDFSDSDMSVCIRQDGGTCTTFAQAYPPFPECDFSGGTDLALDWLGVTVLLCMTLYGLRHIIALFDGSHEK